MSNKITATSGLKQKYIKEVVPKLKKEFGIKNISAMPKIEKIVVNSGTGDLVKNKEATAQFKKDFAAITGQAPLVRPAKISVAGFSVREGMPVGLKVTLRGSRMYSFLERLQSTVLPRLRDFRGVSLKSFDKNGNYTLGIREHTIFPEISSTNSGASRGMEVTIVTSTSDREQSKKMLELLGMPFEKEEEEKKEK